MKIKYIVLVLLIICSINNVSASFGDEIYIANMYCDMFGCTDLKSIDDKFLLYYTTNSCGCALALGAINETIDNNIDWISYAGCGAGYGTPRPGSVSSINNTHFIIATMKHGGAPSVQCGIGNILNDVITTSSYQTVGVFNYWNKVSVQVINDTHFVLVYSSNSVSYCVIGKVSGSTITYGNINTFNSGVIFPKIQIIDDTNFIIFYGDQSNGNYGTYIHGEIIGNNINFDSKIVFNGVGINNLMVDRQNDKYIITFIEGGNISSMVGDITGSNINFGSKYNSNYPASSFGVQFLNTDEFIIMHTYDASVLYFRGNIVGNVINYDSTSTLKTFSSGYALHLYLSAYNADCFLCTYNSGYGGAGNGYGVLYNDPPPGFITTNSTQTDYTQTFDDLFEDLSVWSFLTVIFAAFEAECGGDLFWLIIIMIPFTMTWIKQRSVIIPSILALVCGSVLFTMVPESAIAPIKILLTIGIAGIFYHIIKSR